ncbi:MAG: hypothetical protein KBF35_01220 [Saprospiraceae bacterium]|jgi:hypothetical protein|nr:hypothetical protein [Saprospiraceae bacterium]
MISATQIIDKTIEYVIFEKWKRFLLFLLAVSITTIIFFTLKRYVDSFISPFVGILTLVTALGLSLHNYYKEWVSSLPKSLTSHFVYQGKYYMSCFYSDLTSEADIRQWAQQIGGQMGDQLLCLDPFFKVEQPQIIKLPSNGELVLHYTVTMYMYSLEDKSKKNGFIPEGYHRWYIYNDAKSNPTKIVLPHIEAPVASWIEPSLIELKQQHGV